MQKIRSGFILFWILLAAIVVFYSWRVGVNSAPQIGQDLHHAEIKERVGRERNLKRRAEVTVPDLHELLQESGRSDDLVPEKSIRPVLTEERDLPEDESIEYMKEPSTGVYPDRTYTPDKDSGVSGVRHREMDEDGIDLLKPVPEDPSEVPDRKEKEENAPIKNRQMRSDPADGAKSNNGLELLPLE